MGVKTIHRTVEAKWMPDFSPREFEEKPSRAVKDLLAFFACVSGA